MKTLLRLFTCFVLIMSLGRAADLSAPDVKSASDYFLKLRMAFVTDPNFQANWASWVNDPEREALLKLYDENSPKEFIAKSTDWLKKCPVDAKVHLMLAGLLLKADNMDGSLYHRLMFYGLTTSITASGDGKTAKSAYKVIAIDEEYTILNYIGAKLDRQSLQGSCDVMEVTLDGKPQVIYFDASIPLEAESRALNQGKPK